MRFACACVCFLLTSTLPARAEDWPEWRGKGRRGVWNESGIVDSFPPQGPTIAWRTPIGSGFSGPAVARGRVFVLDFSRETGSKGTERALCLDERTGRILWTKSWPVDYRGMQETYATGPRATPTTRPGNRRQAGAVHWSHPAYANRGIYVRNDEENLAASLAR